MIDNLRAMFIFAKTVENGSFRGASKMLGISPSVVSYHISQLEKRFSVALLYRSTRKLSLTHEGDRLFQHAKTMIEAAEHGLDVLAGHSAAPGGQLNVTLPAAFSRSELIHSISGFAHAFPKVNLTIGFDDGHQDLISNGIDIAIRTGELKNSSLKSRRIMVLERKLVASPEYCAARTTPKSPAELKNWDWIRLKMLPPSRTLTNRKGESIKVHYESRLVVDNVEAMCEFAIDGLGLATPPVFLVEEAMVAGQLVYVLPAWKIEPLSVYAVWPSNAPREGLTSRFVNFLMDSVSAG
jgi:DNA-binding transcriptional LysR family regulator